MSSRMFADLLEQSQPVEAHNRSPQSLDFKALAPEETVPRTLTPPTTTIQSPASHPSNEQTNIRSNERPVERTVIQPEVRTDRRTKVRHSFDMFQDQLWALGDMQQALARRQGRKPRIGDLVQEALDSFIREPTNDASNGGTNETTIEPTPQQAVAKSGEPDVDRSGACPPLIPGRSGH